MVSAAPRSFLGWLRQYVGDRRRSPRRGARYAAHVPAVVTLLEAGAEFGPEAPRSPSAEGETRDLGPSGLTLWVGRIRVGGQYLTDAEQHLGVRLELPAGGVSLLARAVRFEPPEGGDARGYLLGLRILKVREEDLAVYTGFLRTLVPLERRRRELARTPQELLRLATSGAEIGRTDDGLTTEEIAGAFERFVGRGGPRGRS
jgi:hypothetical protein